MGSKRDTRSEGTRAHYRNAAYYDQAYRRRRSDVRFYELEIERRLAGRRGPVLELGVGTGRVALALARRGIDVVGVDLMPEMLERFEKRLQKEPARVRDRVELRQGDLKTLRLTRRFPVVISPFNVLQHLYTRRDWEQALETVHRHLRSAGVFVFDILLPDPFVLSRDPHRRYSGGRLKHPDGNTYRYYEYYDYDPESQVQTITMEFAHPTKAKGHMTPLTHRQVFPAELDSLLHYNGFRVESHHGDFAGGNICAESESQVVIARPMRP